jgi:hypothetical protein
LVERLFLRFITLIKNAVLLIAPFVSWPASGIAIALILVLAAGLYVTAEQLRRES